MDAKKGASYKVNETAWQEAVGTSKPRWEWLEEKVAVKELRPEHASYPGVFDISAVENGKSVVSRPELDVFGLAMLGGGRVHGTAHVYGMKEHMMRYLFAVIMLTSQRLSMGFTRRCCDR